MTSLREMIEARLRDGARVVEVARANRADIAARLHELEQVDEARMLALIDLQIELMESANAELDEAYRGFEERVGELGESLNHHAAAELERVLWHAQGRIAEPFGPEMLELYGLEESPPAGYRALATYAHNAVTLLQAHPQVLDGQFDDRLETEKIAEKIAEPLHALNDYLATLDSSSPALKSALVDRDGASDRWVRVWRGVATVLEGLFLQAERGDLAAAVRPRSPGATVEEESNLFDDIDPDAIERDAGL